MKYLLLLPLVGALMIGCGGKPTSKQMPVAEQKNEGISSPSLPAYCKFFQSKKTGLWVIKNVADCGSLLGYGRTPTQPNIGFLFFTTVDKLPEYHVLECKDTTELKKYWQLYWDREYPKLKQKAEILNKKNEYE